MLKFYRSKILKNSNEFLCLHTTSQLNKHKLYSLIFLNYLLSNFNNTNYALKLLNVAYKNKKSVIMLLHFFINIFNFGFLLNCF